MILDELIRTPAHLFWYSLSPRLFCRWRMRNFYRQYDSYYDEYQRLKKESK